MNECMAACNLEQHNRFGGGLVFQLVGIFCTTNTSYGSCSRVVSNMVEHDLIIV